MVFRKDQKTLFVKMGIKSEYSIQPIFADDLKAGAIYKRKIPAICGQECAHAAFMNILIHPKNFDHGQVVAFEKTNCIDTKTMLKQHGCFENDVVAAKESIA